MQYAPYPESGVYVDPDAGQLAPCSRRRAPNPLSEAEAPCICSCSCVCSASWARNRAMAPSQSPGVVGWLVVAWGRPAQTQSISC